MYVFLLLTTLSLLNIFPRPRKPVVVIAFMVEAEWVSASERKKKSFRLLFLFVFLAASLLPPTMYKTFVFYASAKIINNMQCDNTEKRRRWRWGKEAKRSWRRKDEKLFILSFFFLFSLLYNKMSDFPMRKARRETATRWSQRKNEQHTNDSKSRTTTVNFMAERIFCRCRAQRLSAEWVYLHDTDEDKFALLARSKCLPLPSCVYNKEASAEDKMKKRAKKNCNINITTRIFDAI